MVSQRQIAERQRVEGNALYAQGQYTAAFQCYENGLDAEKHNMALHSNAAQVLIKMGCYVQAIEHCDKVRVLRLMQCRSVSKSQKLAFEACLGISRSQWLTNRLP